MLLPPHMDKIPADVVSSNLSSHLPKPTVTIPAQVTVPNEKPKRISNSYTTSTVHSRHSRPLSTPKKSTARVCVRVLLSS
ncbi:unnamed protein product, partial [Ilex paraguariensis]